MIGIIIQARTGSTRFPNKIFTDINGKYTLQRVLDGVTSSKLVHKIILAMPEYDRDEIRKRVEKGELNKYLTHRGFSIFCGDPDDLVKRYYDVAGINGIDLIVRITADCPFIQGNIIDDMLHTYLQNGYNGFMSNNESICQKPFPDGLDVEIFPWWLLTATHRCATSESDREHVTPFMYRDGVSQYVNNKIYAFDNNSRITMKHPNFSFDTEEDYKLIIKIAEEYDKSGDLNQALGLVSG